MTGVAKSINLDHQIMKTTQRFLIIALAIGLTQVASADPTFPAGPGLFLYDEATGISAFAPIVGGSASYTGPVGDYTMVISATGITVAGGSYPALNLDVDAAVAGSGATKLDVYYSDGTFGPTVNASYTLTTTGPLSGGPVFTSAGKSSTVFGDSQNLGGSVDVPPSTLNAAGVYSDNGYFITLEDSITGSAAGLDTYFVTVPEPANLMWEGILLLSLGIGARRFSRKSRPA